MYRFIESIKLEDGQFHRLHLHQARMDRAWREIFKMKNELNLNTILQNQTFPKSGLYKCRIVYHKQIESVEFIPYQARSIRCLKVIHDQAIDYTHKFEDRSRLNTWFEQRQSCDDILIVKNGLVSDSSFSNIIFFDGDKWVTPDSPLLKGTRRQFLLEAAEIKEETIPVERIPSFKSFRLINSMLGFDGPEMEVSNIVL